MTPTTTPATPATAPAASRPGARAVVGLVLFALLVPAALLVAGGDQGWLAGWAYAALFVVSIVASRLIAVRLHPDLLAERGRFTSAEDVPAWDRALMPVVGLLAPLAGAVVAGLDHRFGWSPALPAAVQWFGALGVAAGFALATWAMAANRFFSAVARIQTERGHSVVSAGPYRYVRHPGYTGGLLSYLAGPFMLATLGALVPALLAAAALVARTALEDRLLMAGLPGYPAYAARTRFRLIPGLW
jgi:protein-S-isoprenylcysteine O-methyltransferase Ste14